MSKGPLVIRTKLYKHREAEEKEAECRQQEEWRLVGKAHKRKEKETSAFYRKEKEKQKPINEPQVGEYSKCRERGIWLSKAIIIIATLLAVVVYIVLNL